MGADTYQSLQKQFDALNALYDQNIAAVRQLQATLQTDILPGIADEQDWDERQVESAAEWLSDTASIFRMLKRHKFTSSFALEALQNTLTWRAQTFPPLASHLSSAYLKCLPAPAKDPFGRPIIVVQLAGLLENTPDLRLSLIQVAELLRLHLVRLNQHAGDGIPRPVLQYIVLLDIGGMTLNNMHRMDVLGWCVHDLLPRYPGMLAAVCILNYTWAHAGLWNVAKRILPASALEKVFFLSSAELRQLLSPAALPEDWGGALPPISTLASPLDSYVVPAASEPRPRAAAVPEPHPEEPAAPLQTVLSATSLLNPFFGYPSVHDPLAAPTPRHGRRRKRDLLRTLARLWWARWRFPATLLLLLVLVILTLRRTRWAGRLALLVRPLARPAGLCCPARVHAPTPLHR